ncbi:PPC domain-containing protein [Sorangium cellulosum]|uniref:PPC domain-containing protein n=1 Tax=Sorangium TaxID=39643 RepID=UPI000ADE5704|nr:PPC domain-containing protein [Sorangium cellulosum]
MERRWRWLFVVVPALMGSLEGCDHGPWLAALPVDSVLRGDAAGPKVKPIGASCGCDADCDGAGALCVLGICMQRAEGLCAAPNSEEGCAPGSRCFNTDILTDTGVCYPVYDPATCEGVESRHGLCSPRRGEGCNPACGVACAEDSVGAGDVGAACETAEACSLRGATCYSDASTAEPNGWVEGYCLAFDCASDDECGPEAGCFPAAAGGAPVCMNTCGSDLDCRPGYVCHVVDGASSPACFAGCDAAATCPAGTTCLGELCVSDDVACSPDVPSGWCPEGERCDDGVCRKDVSACESGGDVLEPNDAPGAAVSAPAGVTEGLTVCEGDEDWFRIVVPEGTIVRVGIQLSDPAGDLDLVAYDGEGRLLGSRYGEQYPYSYRDQETDIEAYGFYSERGGAEYLVRVVGHEGAQNTYRLDVTSYPYVDGPSCVSAGFSFDDCAGFGDGGSGLLPFPFPDPDDSVVGGGYVWETFSNYRFARRELIMLVRDALSETLGAFPGTTPLSLIDVCQIDGVTPGYDIGDPRHPESTHDQGGNIDIAYFQTDGSNDGEIICGDGSKHEDGYCSSAAKRNHIVDLERQAFFMARLFRSPRTRVIGVDKILAPFLSKTAARLNALPARDPRRITDAELASFSDRMAYGSGWPYHHHHIHLSMDWWPKRAAAGGGPAAASFASSPVIHRSPAVAAQRMVWPPRP